MSLNLVGYTLPQLTELCEQIGEPKYRAKQIANWIYTNSVQHSDAMANLPVSLRHKLSSIAEIRRHQVINSQISIDGTRKFLYELADKANIESVYLPYSDHHSVCVSTQVGCAAGCSFCATGRSGFLRHLTAGEIVDQVMTIQDITQQRISHVVYMGMGEPLWNMHNVLQSVEILNQQIGISERSITVSTVGIAPKIRELADQHPRFTLAISLHAPDDETRLRIMPISKRWSIHEILDAGRYYTEVTGRKVTIEYLLIDGINNSMPQARLLASLLKNWIGNVNIIPWNYVSEMPEYASPSFENINAFVHTLESSGVAVTIRQQRGADIAASCGQLRRQHSLQPQHPVDDQQSTL